MRALGLSRRRERAGLHRTGRGAIDASALSARNLAHKKDACTLQGQPLYTSATWGDPPCTTTGSLGHCTWAVTNTYDPSSGNVTSHTDTAWTVP